MSGHRDQAAASVYHVRKEDLREGSALDVDPPFPAFDVVHRQAYERLAEEVERLRELLARFENESPKHIRRRIFDGR